ncbi:hypothetical protein PsYK624_125610 [Phanerochaete sordida]|uniref:Uncharacterized protein n=1 Tax=Phanerochaete sordida TaxID=48140 RepID=A0A9P3GJY7_9APHY|nr:hypothetical protein PsYK624_125610 [Phanerochaete sordida]
MERFSWTDNLRAAFTPCLACLQPRTGDDAEDDERQQQNHHYASRGPDYVPRARPDELEGLLQDTDDADTMSLHSNIGRDDPRKRKRRRKPKGIRLFGFDLFGKPPIQLSDDEDGVYRSPRSRTISASTLDSDAAPLDPSTIAQLSAARAAEGAAQLEEERLAKEERRRLRREKKAAKQAALALALERSQDEFEGFPGSGPSYVVSPSTDAPSSSGYSQDEFGPFEHASPLPPHVREETDADGADFGGDAYAQRPRRGSAMSRSASDSQSRTSGTSSAHTHAHANLPPPRRPQSSRRSASSASQSLSLSSPPPHTVSFPAVAPLDMAALAEAPADDVITIDTPGGFPSGGFPSVGFSGGMRRKNSEAGVFLARRGDE